MAQYIMKSIFKRLVLHKLFVKRLAIKPTLGRGKNIDLNHFLMKKVIDEGEMKSFVTFSIEETQMSLINNGKKREN